MIGLALSGGGSRAIAFHLGCLRALNDLGILDEVGVLSTISGGSVIGAYYAYSPQKSFEEFEADMRTILRRGFHRSIVREFLTPKSLLAGARNLSLAAAHSVLGIGRRDMTPSARRPSRTDLFRHVLRRDVFGVTELTASRRKNMDVVIGACELRTGSAFRFSNKSVGGWRHGQAVNCESDVAFAVAASAAYPLLLPTLDRTWEFQKTGSVTKHRILLTDGGLYDNLGVQVLEPNRSEEFSLHSFECDYLIVCSAGQGQESGSQLPFRFFSRISKSFDVVHRRVQDSTMHRLHQLKEGGRLKGFALPYLGQQDRSLFYRPPDLVPRESVISYPTNFAPMSDEWIDRLSLRGDQLTRLLVPHYLAQICH
jgi:NTE family protein